MHAALATGLDRHGLAAATGGTTRQTVYMLRSSPEVAQRGFDARLTRS